MNTFNRVSLVLLCLVLMFGAAAITALAWGGPDESIDWLRDAINWLDERNTDGTKFIITTAAVVVMMMSLTVLIVELYPRAGGQVKVTDLHVGDAVLSTAAIGQRVEEAVTLVPDVADVRATVRAKRKGVVVNLDLHVDPQANLAAVIDEASEAARTVLTEKVHVALAEPPRTRIHYRELRLRGRPPRRPAAIETVVSEPEPVTPDEPEVEAPAENQEETAVKA
ncbi:MAG TPA: alkaline shock response membrane anchor protein AmaP [Dehalococcoidia bacterium]|nr:alkaline shock response membrane anchor protein AmaP [Dehalococcoidia bacterium]